MRTIGSILVPVDFSAGSAAALRYALALREGDRAIAAEARIRVVHAAHFPPSLRSHAQGDRRHELLERLDGFIGEMAGPAAAVIARAVLDGDARSELPEQASMSDLVVVGATGLSRPGELVPGGVAEALIRRSPAPVITVKWARGTRADPDVPPREIVLATDLTEHSNAAVEHAMRFAFAYDARLTALHVAASPRDIDAALPVPIELGEAIDAFYEKELGWRRDELGRFVRDRLRVERPIEIRGVVRSGKAAEEIAAECRERGADLLVLATHGRSGLGRAFMGSVAERALRLAPCPVLTVRPAV